MKLTNIFKSASPFVNNLLSFLVMVFLFIEANQTQIESWFNRGEVSNVGFMNYFTIILFIGGLLKAFTAKDSATGPPKRLKTVLLPLLIKLLTYLTREPEKPVENTTPIPDAPLIQNPTP